MNEVNGLNFSQQCRLFDPKMARAVHVIGVGSVGSHVVNNLVRVGVTDITVWDDDSIDSHNIGPSLYGHNDLGQYKVDALAHLVLRDTGVCVKVMRKMYEGEPIRGTIVSSVDNMEARKLIWGSIKKKLFADILLDTRVAENFAQIFATRPCNESDIAHYEHYLSYSTEEANRQMCGGHSIVFIASRVAATAVECLCDFWSSGKTMFVRLEQLGSDVFIHPQPKGAGI